MEACFVRWTVEVYSDLLACQVIRRDAPVVLSTGDGEANDKSSELARVERDTMSA
jgi:hypothetical protein